MWARFVQALRDLVTGKDGKTWDLGRLSWAGCSAAVVVLAGWQEAHGTTVPLRDLALSLSGIAVTHGAALGLKASTEPAAPSGGPDA